MSAFRRRWRAASRNASRTPPLVTDLSAVDQFILGAAWPAPEAWRPTQHRAGDGAEPRRNAGEITIDLLEPGRILEATIANTLWVRVHNGTGHLLSSEGHGDGRGHALTYFWVGADGSREEGARTLLLDDLAPGEACTVPMRIGARDTAGPATLCIRVVDEGVQWLTGGVDAPWVLGEPQTSRELRPGGPPIPRVIHRVWVGGAEMPAAHVAYGESWARHHPDWEIRLWTDANVPRVAGRDRARTMSEYSDLVRYEVLRRHGGVYADTDVECLRPIDELLSGVAAFAGFEYSGHLGNAVMGAVPGHPAVEELLRLSSLACGHGTYPASTGPPLTSMVLPKYDDVTLFSQDRFYPVLWDGSTRTGTEAPYTDHHWALSWQGASSSGSEPGAGG